MSADTPNVDPAKSSAVMALLNRRPSLGHQLRSLAGYGSKMTPEQAVVLFKRIAIAAERYGCVVGASTFILAAQSLFEDVESGASLPIAYVRADAPPVPDPYDPPTLEEIQRASAAPPEPV